MRKIELIFFVILFFSAFFIGCEINNDNNTPDPVEYNVRYILENGAYFFPSSGFPAGSFIALIKSKQELMEWREAAMQAFMFSWLNFPADNVVEREAYTVAELSNITDKYDQTFFESGCLAMIQFSTPSISYKYSVKKIDISGGTSTIKFFIQGGDGVALGAIGSVSAVVEICSNVIDEVKVIGAAYNSDFTGTGYNTFDTIPWEAYGDVYFDKATNSVLGVSFNITDVIIEPEYDGVPVLTIRANGFRYRKKLESITIPASVTNIGGGAFWGCVNLQEVIFLNDSQLTDIGDCAFFDCGKLSNITLPEKLETIGGSAFRSSGLTSITIPKNVSKIGIYTFISCIDLMEMNVANENTFFRSENNCIISKSDEALMFGCNVSTIPHGVKIIGDGAFDGCDRLAEITIPNTVIAINFNAFSFCTSLTEIIIPDSVKTIGAHAFNYCSGLTGIIIPAGVTYIGDHAFRGCENLASIFIMGNPATHINWNGGCNAAIIYDNK